MRVLVRQMLRSLGVAHVLEANDGSSALMVMRDNPVDLIISDWNMIPMTGLQLLQAVRAEPATKRLPFIMITGEHSAEHVVRARQAGVNGYLVKPFGRDLLNKQLARALGERHAA
jgi:two-component system chemotaxis response regulator CheY